MGHTEIHCLLSPLCRENLDEHISTLNTCIQLNMINSDILDGKSKQLFTARYSSGLRLYLSY